MRTNKPIVYDAEIVDEEEDSTVSDLSGILDFAKKIPWWVYAGAATIALLASSKKVRGSILSIIRSLGHKEPSAEILAAVAKYSDIYKVPQEIILAVIGTETSYSDNIGDNWFNDEPDSYEYFKNKKIPGVDFTWGSRYKKAEWGSYGPMQIMPFNFMGNKPGMLAPGELFIKANDVDFNIKIGTRMLAWLWKEYGNWKDVFSAYNTGDPYDGRAKQIKYLTRAQTFFDPLTGGSLV